jgi:hypothetical protein
MGKKQPKGNGSDSVWDPGEDCIVIREGVERRKTDTCDDRYVRWNIAVSFAAGFIAVVVAIAFAQGKWQATTDIRIETIETDVSTLQNIGNDIDTVKLYLREMRSENGRK